MPRMQTTIETSIDAVQATVLALIQGLTEFLPISSSAHLALVPLLTSWPDQGLAFDCVVHLGSLTAVVIYFRSDLARMFAGLWHTVQVRSLTANHEGYLAWLIGFATIPVGLAGLTFKDYIEHDLRSLAVIGLASIVFGLLLWYADQTGANRRQEGEWSFRDAMIVGVAQAVALIPGTSRSGITMTAAMMLGYTRQAAARFSFLLSIPVIVLAGGLKVKDWIETPDQPADAMVLMLGYGLSAVSAYLCIHFFLKYIERTGMGPFVIYRLALGGILLWMVW